MEKLQALLVAFFTSLLSYFHPIHDDLTVLAVVFLSNAIVGHITHIIINHEGFDFKKAWSCIFEFATFSVILACMYIIAHTKGIEDTIMSCISFVGYGVLYFYTCNILKNLKQAFKKESTAYKVVEMLYYLVSVEAIKSLPFLSDYIKQKQKERQKENEEN